MKSRLLMLVGILVVMFLVSLPVYTYYKMPKIVFVNSSVLIDRYVGMQEVRQLIEARTKSLTHRLDSLYSISVGGEYVGGLSKSIKLKDGVAVSKYQSYLRIKEEAEAAAKDENDKLVQGALNQINSFIDTYSKEHGIDIVLGVAASGSILYGSERVDVTSDVVEALNKTYK